MQPKKVSEEQLGHLCFCVMHGYGEKVRILCQSVNENKDAVLALHHGQPCDEFHQYALPFPLWNGKRLQQPCWMVHIPLVVLVNFALPDMLEDVLLEVLP